MSANTPTERQTGVAIKSIFSEAWTVAPVQVVLVVTISVCVGLLDGLAMTLLFPLIALIANTSATETPYAAYLTRAFEAFGAPVTIPTVLLAMVGLVAIQSALAVVQVVTTARLSRRYATSVKDRIWSAYFEADWRFFLKHSASDLVVAVTHVDRAAIVLAQTLQLVSTAIVTILYAAIATYAAWQIAVALLVMGALSLFLTRAILSHARSVGTTTVLTTGQLNATVMETVRAFKYIKATGSEAPLKRQLLRLNDRSSLLAAQSMLHPAAIRAVFELVAVVTISGALALAAATDLFALTTALAVIFIFIRIYPRITTMQQQAHAIVSHSAGTPERHALLRDALACAPPALVRPTTPIPERPTIEFAHATFAYDKTTAVDGFDLVIPWGKVIALVGDSGGGKSTVAESLMGLIRPLSGAVRVGGINLNDLDLRSWRKRVGYVGQNVMIFSASVRENIAWGADEPSDRDIENAARLANAHEFIVDLPDGYDTQLGDGGRGLSGGQQQRIALARALLNARDVLILDEPTSALDSNSEALITDAVAKLKGKLTTIVVAHRLATIQHADQIVVLSQGRIAEFGSLQSLLANDGPFAALWRAQLANADAATTVADA